MAELGDPLVQRFRRARRDPSLTVLDGFHALRHALTFGAEILELALAPGDACGGLGALLAPGAPPPAPVREVTAEQLSLLSPQGARVGAMAIARRPRVDAAAALADPRPEPAVLLEAPQDLGNLGACVRAAAAADAAALLSTGHNDPWHPDAVRGAQALQFALPVARIESLPESLDRPLLAVEVGGEPLRPAELPPRALLAFGGERHGLSPELLKRADARVAIPMRAGVASLNLATAVAVVLLSRRMATR